VGTLNEYSLIDKNKTMSVSINDKTAADATEGQRKVINIINIL